MFYSGFKEVLHLEEKHPMLYTEKYLKVKLTAIDQKKIIK